MQFPIADGGANAKWVESTNKPFARMILSMTKLYRPLRMTFAAWAHEWFVIRKLESILLSSADLRDLREHFHRWVLYLLPRGDCHSRLSRSPIGNA
jgi:hypothetical protein